MPSPFDNGIAEHALQICKCPTSSHGHWNDRIPFLEKNYFAYLIGLNDKYGFSHMENRSNACKEQSNNFQISIVLKKRSL